MINVSLSKKHSLGIRFAIAVYSVAIISSPLSVIATTVMPTQVLPPSTGQSCAPVTFSDIQTYIYSGHLDSFDVTLSDSSYVAVSTSVNQDPVPLNYVTRWANPDGSVRMHVDIQSTPLSRDIPIQITFLSAHNNLLGTPVTCIFNIPATVLSSSRNSTTGGTTNGTPAVGGGTSSVGQTTGQPLGQGTSAGVTTGTGASGSNGQTGHPIKTPTPTNVSSSTAGSTSTNPAIVSATSSLGNLCVDGGSSKLWIILLILYALFVITLCAQRFDTASRIREWNIALILAVFLGLLIFWYVSAVCRTGPWAPAITTLIAVAGLLYSMLRQPQNSEMLLLKGGKK